MSHASEESKKMLETFDATDPAHSEAWVLHRMTRAWEGEQKNDSGHSQS